MHEWDNVCAVAEHMCEMIHCAEFEKRTTPEKYQIFDDVPTTGLKPSHHLLLSSIRNYISMVMLETQMESNCLIPAMIYVKRIERNTDGQLRLNLSNWRSVLGVCMMISSKVWDDVSMVNSDFNSVFVQSTLNRLNKMEVVVLKILNFGVEISPKEYHSFEQTMSQHCSLDSDDDTADCDFLSESSNSFYRDHTRRITVRSSPESERHIEPPQLNSWKINRIMVSIMRFWKHNASSKVFCI